jgi:hypothetical protein
MLFSKIKSVLKFIIIKFGARFVATRVYRRLEFIPAVDVEGVDRVLNIISLSSHRFGPDLKLLSETGRFNIYKMPIKEQFQIPFWFVNKDQSSRQHYLQKIISYLNTKINIDSFLSVTFWYENDCLWGEAAEQAGIPYIAFHKECYKTEPKQLTMTVRRGFEACPNGFPGSHIIVYNQTIKDIIIQGGFVTEDKVSVLGSMRMDSLVKRIQKQDTKEESLVTLFSFSPGIGLDDLDCGPWPKNPYLGWVQLFRETHIAFARAAILCPDTEFVIKPKWGNAWIDHIKLALKSVSIDLDDVPNLTISLDRNPTDLILKSKVVCGFQSTTTLEAGLADKPVIVPEFAEVIDPAYKDYVKLRNDFDIYEVATTPEIFTQKILECLKNKTISEDIVRKRKQLFEKWISTLNGNATELYVNKLEELMS